VAGVVGRVAGGASVPGVGVSFESLLLAATRLTTTTRMSAITPKITAAAEPPDFDSTTVVDGPSSWSVVASASPGTDGTFRPAEVPGRPCL